MIPPATPSDEAARLDALRALDLLDSDAEERFDRYTRLAKRLFGVPIALVSLVDARRQWFKSRQGLDAAETPRDVSFCGHAILGDEPFVVDDATRDERFHDNPLVIGAPHVRFYAGYPLRTRDGIKVGTLCVIDHEPRTLEPCDEALLRDLGEMVESELSAIEMATIDELTGLSNRRGFVAMGVQALASCHRRGTPASLIYVDLDGFKPINDGFGHAEGDRALTAFGALLLDSFRDSDIVGRLGGDEFAVLAVDADESRASISLARLERAVEHRNCAPTSRYPLRFSAGIVEFDPASSESIEQLLDRADALMYEHKRSRKPARARSA